MGLFAQNPKFANITLSRAWQIFSWVLRWWFKIVKFMVLSRLGVGVMGRISATGAFTDMNTLHLSTHTLNWSAPDSIRSRPTSHLPTTNSTGCILQSVHEFGCLQPFLECNIIYSWKLPAIFSESWTSACVWATHITPVVTLTNVRRNMLTNVSRHPDTSLDKQEIISILR